MRNLLVAAVTFLSINSVALAQWWTGTAGKMSTTNSVGIGQGTDANGNPDIAYGDSALRLGFPVSSGCGSGIDTLARCFSMSLGNHSAQYWGFRLDTDYDLHFDRQSNSGWAEGVIFYRSGDVTFPANVNLPNTHIGLRASPYADTTLRLAFPAGAPDQCGGTNDRGPGRCFQMSFGTNGGQYWGYRLDPQSDLHIDRWVDNVGWVEDVRFTRGGDVTFAGNVSGNKIQALYQDVAEWVPAATEMRPGTVVVLNPSTPNEVMPSARSYDTAVAGVVSSEPGVLLGQPAASKAKIATTGRVKVRVEASRLPIRIGDLLVTSDRAGVAMRSEPVDVGGVKMHRPGTLIGKALEPLPSGNGEILVLLSLQ